MPQISVNGSLKSLGAPSVSLSTGMDVSGTLGKVTLGLASGMISVQGAGAGQSSFTFDGARNLTLNSPNQGIASIRTGFWYDDRSHTVTTPLLGSLRVSHSFEPRLVVGSPAAPTTAKVLGSATIGAGTLGEWNIHGSAGPISVRYFGGNVEIDGAAASVRTMDYLGLEGEPGSHALTFGGKTSIKAAGERINIRQGATLHTASTAPTYDLAGLAGYNHAGQQWTYNASYRGGMGIGQTTASTWTQAGSNGSITMYTRIDELLSSMAWTAGPSGTVLNRLGLDAPELGELYLHFSAPYETAGGALTSRSTATSTASVYGTWENPMNLDAQYGSVFVSLGGTATLRVKSLGYEDVAVDYGEGHYLAQKLEMKVAIAKAPMTVYVQGRSMRGSYKLVQTQTVWCVPGLGIVKQQGVVTLGIAAAGQGGSGTVRSTMVLSDHSG